MILIVVLSLVASLLWGASDFFGGLATRRLTVLPVTLVAYLAGAAVIAIALAFGGWAWSPLALLTGSIAAVAAMVGFIAFYAALAIGPMSVLSPVMALIEAFVPIAVSIATGQALSALGWVAVGLAIVATIVISLQSKAEQARVTPRGAVLAVIAGLGLGASIVALDFAPKDSGLLPAFLEMGIGLVLLGAFMLLLRVTGLRIGWFAAEAEPESGPVPGAAAGRRRAWLMAAGGGVLLGGANALLMTALHLGNLAVVSVLSALYPIATVILAAAVLKERITAARAAGIVLAIVASVLLSLS
jgi:drug/metabolite transporter (DMT)-like permease